MRYTIYFAINLFYQIFSIWFLLFANSYLNEYLLPKDLKWSNGNLKNNLTTFFYAKSFILVIEFVLLTVIIIITNKWFLNQFIINKANPLFNWTISIYLIITLLFVILLIWTIFSKWSRLYKYNSSWTYKYFFCT